jgi:hypothetical protein
VVDRPELFRLSSMQKILIALTLASGACASRPKIVATPDQKVEAITLFIKGANAAEVAAHLGIAREQALELIHITLKELSKKYYANR